MQYIFLVMLTVIAVYTLAMMISFAKTGKPDPKEKFRICWWKE